MPRKPNSSPPKPAAKRAAAPTVPTPKKARAKAAAAAKRKAARQAAALLARRKAAFLVEFEAKHLVSDAAKAAQVHRSTVYEWRATDEAFAAGWAEVEERSTELLEREAYRRAAVGTDKPVYHKGELVDTYKEFSDVLMIFLLKARRPGTYRENQRIEHVGADGGPIAAEITTVDAKEASDAAHDFLARLAGSSA